MNKDKASIVLASGSPRRRELLEMIGIKSFKVIADTSDEPILPDISPEQQVLKLALKKAGNVSKKCAEEDLIIAADTLVYLGNIPLEKPSSEEDAANMLRMLSGKKHTVYTGVVVARGEISETAVEKTDVYFRDVSEDEIIAYVGTGEPMDKAGGYAAQGRAAAFIERIDGDFFTVMGFPICRLVQMLKKF
ncbi:MAG: Maf family protein [Oscillospiraceae bacterium]|nr:Maf family protein [Oscillospiraceae bacterium]MCL2279230.1 Maf family protein [Oscillospiraceae bacterium]